MGNRTRLLISHKAHKVHMFKKLSQFAVAFFRPYS